MLPRKAGEPALEKAKNRKVCPSGPGGSQVPITLLERTGLILSALTTSFTSVISPDSPKEKRPGVSCCHLNHLAGYQMLQCAFWIF